MSYTDKCPGCGWRADLVFHHWPTYSGRQEAVKKDKYAYVCAGCNNALSRLFPNIGDVSWDEQLKLLRTYHRRLDELAKVLRNRDCPTYSENTQRLLELLRDSHRKGLGFAELDKLFEEYVANHPGVEEDLLPNSYDKLTRAEGRRRNLAVALQTYEPNPIREVELAIEFQVPLDTLRHDIRTIRRINA